MADFSRDEEPTHTYSGHCHCGAVRFNVQCPELKEVTECDCSICGRNGYMWIYPKRENFAYTRGEDKLKGYKFGKKAVAHNFCTECGSSVTGDAEAYPIMAVNVRMLAGVDLRSLKVKQLSAKDYGEPYSIGP